MYYVEANRLEAQRTQRYRGNDFTWHCVYINRVLHYEELILINGEPVRF